MCYLKNLSLILLLICLSCKNSKLDSPHDNPKLVVAIVVDQMRYDYLNKYKSKFSKNGFNRLIKNGYNLKNNHFNYVPTVTGPGHASISTGSTPKDHGIAGNNWFDKSSNKYVYCTTDLEYENLGGNAYSAKMSPMNLMIPTFGDVNKFKNINSKTISIALKDRGSILMGGRKADAAYWFFGKDKGEWVSSNYYMKELPKWVTKFNNSDYVSSYMGCWNTIYDIDTYHESRADENDFEKFFKGDSSVSFPYNLKKLMYLNDGYDMLKESPFGNSLTTDFALEAMINEDLGKDEYTDVLTISYSSTDYIGHNFGVDSKETQDAYLRLDLEIERLLYFLDNYVGKNEYTLFLTADHGASKIPAYLNSLGNEIAMNIEESDFDEAMENLLYDNYGSKNLISKIVNNQIYLNDGLIKSLGIDLDEVAITLISFLNSLNYIDGVYTSKEIIEGNFLDGYELLIQNGYHIQRSGDLIFKFKPNVFKYGKRGTSHGSGYHYDTHVPLIFYGKKIKKGESSKRTKITDIAPTIAKIMGNKMDTTTGEVLNYVIK